MVRSKQQSNFQSQWGAKICVAKQPRDDKHLSLRIPRYSHDDDGKSFRDLPIPGSYELLRKLVRLWMNMFFNFSIMPLRVASLMGALFCVIGIIMLTSTLVEALFFKVPQVGWSSLMAAVSLFSGTQLLILGVIGEYVGCSYMTVSGKPQSLIRAVTEHRPTNPPFMH